MNDFSIELASEKIYDSRTKQYFLEVLTSFINGHYRSSVVMLWSVVITDIIYKLQYLKDLYEDDIAIKILDEIHVKQKDKPNNPEWEMWLLTEVKTKTHLLEHSDYESLAFLQKTRHLSAHPVITQEELLFSPNKETTRCLIRNSLEGLLLKPPIFTKKVIHNFIIDIATNKSNLISKESLQKYLNSKYFRNLHPSIEKQLFRDIWKFCFNLDNDDANENREINIRALSFIYERNKAFLTEYFQDNKDYFSVINEKLLGRLIKFLANFPMLFNEFNGAGSTLIRNFSDSNINEKAYALFFSNSFSEHINLLCSYAKDSENVVELNSGTWEFLINKGEELGQISQVYTLGITLYGLSHNFNNADSLFNTYIRPYLNQFNEINLRELLKYTENNAQLRGRRRAKSDYTIVLEKVEEIPGINISEFPAVLGIN